MNALFLNNSNNKKSINNLHTTLCIFCFFVSNSLINLYDQTPSCSRNVLVLLPIFAKFSSKENYFCALFLIFTT